MTQAEQTADKLDFKRVLPIIVIVLVDLICSGGELMTWIANILVALVALLHVGFLVLEMFFWDHPVGRKRFGLTPEFSKASATLAANQGLYNGFLAAGLIWGLVINSTPVQIFFLLCVLIAGIYGGFTARRTILYIQAVPALLALVAVYLSR
jgi:putative membrane protein